MYETNSLEARLKQLLLHAMEGDEVAYQAFITGTDVFVQRYLRHLGGRSFGEETLADVRQEVMLSIHQKKHTYLPSRPLLPWIYAITRYRYIDFYRAQKRTLSSIPLEDVYLVNDEQPFVTLADIMALLTPQQQQLLQLIKVDELSYQEAAQQTGVQVPALRARVSRLLKTLKQKLEE